MNRIALAAESVSAAMSSPGIEDSLDVTTFAHRPLLREQRAPHATFEPIHYERGYAYPLVVWLHGAASNEHELRQVMPLVSLRNYVAIAPRGPSADRRRGSRYGWGQTSDDIEEAQSRIAHCVAHAQQRFNIHANRVFLVGYGSGGTMALRVAWNDPLAFAGVATINGPLPTRLRPLCRMNELRRVPCLLATSRDSREYPASDVCRDLRLLHAAGCTVALRQYPCGDELTSIMLSDLDRWLMDLVCGGMHDS